MLAVSGIVQSTAFPEAGVDPPPPPGVVRDLPANHKVREDVQHSTVFCQCYRVASQSLSVCKTAIWRWHVSEFLENSSAVRSGTLVSFKRNSRTFCPEVLELLALVNKILHNPW